MKVLVFVNEDKDNKLECLNSLKSKLNKEKIDYSVFFDLSKIDGTSYDAIFVIGGDGTLLGLTNYSVKNQIPVIGINAGKLGFLTEFERSEIDKAVNLFIQGQLVLDKRMTLTAEFNGEKFLALNDVVIQRIYLEYRGRIITTKFSLDDKFVDSVSGDGVIISTPTGSTAYSLSVGGTILAQGIDGLSFTPIASHSFEHRPVVFSSNQKCSIELQSDTYAGLFVDGKMVAKLNKGDIINVYKSDKTMSFLRQKDYSFFTKLSEKLRYRAEK